MKILQIDIKKIVPNDWNANVLSEKKLEVLKKKIKDDLENELFVQPILVRPLGKSKYQIIDGEQRFYIYNELGCKKVWCIVVKHGDNEAKLRTLTMNYLRGTPNIIKLAHMIVDLNEQYSLEEIEGLTGYSEDELEFIIKNLDNDELNIEYEDSLDLENFKDDYTEDIHKSDDVIPKPQYTDILEENEDTLTIDSEEIELGEAIVSIAFVVTESQRDFINDILMKVDSSKRGDALFKLCQYYAEQIEDIDFEPEQDSYKKIIGTVKPKDIEVKEINLRLAQKIIEKHHYSHAWPLSNILALGFYADDKLLGVICYGKGAAKNLIPSICKGANESDGWELTRLFSFDWAPKNIESFMIAQSFKFIYRNYPEIKILVSFADPSEGHVGTIYQATNWIYTGKSQGQHFYKVDGKVTHPRTLADYPKEKRKKIKSDPKNRVWKEGKHRYVYFLGSKKQKKKLKKALKLPILPYPKVQEIENKRKDEALKKWLRGDNGAIDEWLTE